MKFKCAMAANMNLLINLIIKLWLISGMTVLHINVLKTIGPTHVQYRPSIIASIIIKKLRGVHLKSYLKTVL